MKFLVALGVAVFIALYILVAYAPKESNAHKALVDAGYSKIQLTSTHRFFAFGCGQDDQAQFNYVATNPTGRRVHLHVCLGWPFKNATIRY